MIPVRNEQGRPYTFDLGFGDFGTGIGWGTTTTNRPSDTVDVNGRSKTDPAVRTATDITCGDRTLHADGVAEQR